MLRKTAPPLKILLPPTTKCFRAELFEQLAGPAQKEVQNYARALRYGFAEARRHGLLTNKLILEIQETLEANRAGFRKLPGTTIKNQQTGEVVHTPPQDYDTIVALMGNLEKIINDDEAWPVDPLIKMAVLHVQFESIHPFYDGNGRTGRILNILYLVNTLRDYPFFRP